MVYQAFGAKLTVVELTAGLLPGIDPDCVKIVEKTITKHGGTILKSARAESIEKKPGGGAKVNVVIGGKTEVIDCDQVLVAVGMKPRSRGIGLEEVGVTIDARGSCPRTSVARRTYRGSMPSATSAARPMLAHKASKEGEVAAEVIAGHHGAKDWVTIPGIVFTDPENRGGRPDGGAGQRRD